MYKLYWKGQHIDEAYSMSEAVDLKHEYNKNLDGGVSIQGEKEPWEDLEWDDGDNDTQINEIC